MAWAVSKSLTPEASEAKEAVEAMQEVADFMKQLGRCLVLVNWVKAALRGFHVAFVDAESNHGRHSSLPVLF